MANFNAVVNEGPRPDVKVVGLAGELDEEAVDILKPQIDTLLADVNIKKIFFDLRSLDFMNSKGIGYLVSVHTHLMKDQRQLFMAGANEAVMDVISLVGLTAIVPHYATIEEAYASL